MFYNWKKTQSAIVPAGTYYLGDPCYAIIDEDWGPLLDACNYFQDGNGEIHGFHIVGLSTAYGDGTYLGTDNVEYFVDAGMIGLVPIEYLETRAPRRLKELLRCSYARFITFDKETVCTNENGYLQFGKITIDTLNETDEEDEDEDY